jgi:hypothetical protein
MGHAARMGEMRNAYSTWWEYLEGRDSSENLRVDAEIILEWILSK